MIKFPSSNFSIHKWVHLLARPSPTKLKPKHWSLLKWQPSWLRCEANTAAPTPAVPLMSSRDSSESVPHRLPCKKSKYPTRWGPKIFSQILSKKSVIQKQQRFQNHRCKAHEQRWMDPYELSSGHNKDSWKTIQQVLRNSSLTQPTKSVLRKHWKKKKVLFFCLYFFFQETVWTEIPSVSLISVLYCLSETWGYNTRWHF